MLEILLATSQILTIVAFLGIIFTLLFRIITTLTQNHPSKVKILMIICPFSFYYLLKSEKSYLYKVILLITFISAIMGLLGLLILRYL
ncbi:MAG: hypothetical protein LBV58_02405 [Acholeplasmatales bacterium]|jgi:hypothetical protein|nr:hypothetical protein [Acholeplasmatales bacterium]